MVPQRMLNPLQFLEGFGFSKRKILAEYAKLCLGRDMDFTVSNEYACAASLNTVARNALGEPIGGGASTFQMLQSLRFSPRWREIQIWQAEAGDVIIAATGTRTEKSPIDAGHVGIVSDSMGLGEYPKKILSNDSYTGKWSDFYTLGSFYDRYARIGKYPIHIYRLIW